MTPFRVQVACCVCAGVWALPSQVRAAAVLEPAQGERGPRHATLAAAATVVDILPSGHLRPRLKGEDADLAAVPDLTHDTPAPRIRCDGAEHPDVALDLSARSETGPTLIAGLAGRAWRLHGRGSGPLAGLEKTLTLEVFDALPGVVLFQAAWRYVGTTPRRLESVVVQRWHLAAGSREPLWALLGASDRPREEAVLPLTAGLTREGLMGAMTAKGRGGGLPLVAFWSRAGGLALGLGETTPRVLSLPARVGSDGVTEATLVLAPGLTLAPGEEYRSPVLFASAFHGDFYEALVGWRTLLEHRGLRLPRPTQAAYEPSWCGWGFGKGVTPEQMLGALPKVVDLGFTWATLDEGWFETYGDGEPRPDFGVEGLRRVVDAYHAQGVRVMLWWLPLAAEDGALRPSGRRRKVARVVEQHPEWRILDRGGQPVHTFAQFALLCPAVPAVQEYHRGLVRRFLGEWGLDGLKIDKVFTVPPCYNPAHGHRSPEEAVERMGETFRVIFEEARRQRPDGVVQICPCATLPNLAWLPYMDQPVTADPEGSAQVRWRTKIYKALFGPQAPVSADHVELTASRWEGSRQLALGRDFASAVGVGAVPGTRFVWPPDPAFDDVSLTPEKEALWRRWLDTARRLRLADGAYRNLYVHGVDWPEGYVIDKDGRTYFAFYMDSPYAPAAGKGRPYRGAVDLRGLAPRAYRVTDVETGRALGRVTGPKARLAVTFDSHILIEAAPE
jgi:alpha-galactosidase